jgi:hypothetical protein
MSVSLPNGRPASYITPPRTEKSLFFIQRNLNQNTIVYDVVMMPNGQFAADPVREYWLRYGSNGEKKELTWLQKNFAYGHSFKKDKKGNGYFITLTAYNARAIHLTRNHMGKPIATLQIDGKNAQLNYIWVYADNSGKWPKVLHVDLHGKDLTTGQVVFERIINK